MNISNFSAPERLVFDVQGLIAEIKTQYFSDTNTPLDDNDTLVHKLCVRLENVLRYGAREKYSFMGAKKDYWNYMSDALPREEIVKFVLSIQELKTNQGKGRALLRQALMEKCFADTFQRCAINEKQTREYYLTDSILRNSTLLQTLVHSLYDLNAIDFNLPHKGYDLDRSFPSFSRKTFGNEQQTSRKDSIRSVQTQEDDPVVMLSGYVNNLASLLNSWFTDEAIKTGDDSLTLRENIDKVKEVTSIFERLRQKCSREEESLTAEINKVKEEKLKSKAEYELRLKQLNERYLSLQNLDTSATQEKMKGLYDKLVATELELTELKAKFQSSVNDNDILSGKLEGIENRNRSLCGEKDELAQLIDEQTTTIERIKKAEHCNDSMSKILESKLAEIQKINSELSAREREANERILTLDSQLKLRDGELESLKNAFQQSTGFVVGSFKEFKDELNVQLQEKSKDIKSISQENENLTAESKSLFDEKSQLTKKTSELEQRLSSESKKREDAEKMILEQKQRIAVEMKHCAFMTRCMKEVWACLSDESDEFNSSTISENETKDTSVVALAQEKFVKKLKGLKEQVDGMKSSVITYEDNIVEMQKRLEHKCTEHSHTVKNLENCNNQLGELKKELKELQDEHANVRKHKQNIEQGTITNLQTENSRMVDQLKKTQENSENFEKKCVEMEIELNKLKPLVDESAAELETAVTEQDRLQGIVNKLQSELDLEKQGNQSATSSLQSFHAKETSYKKEMKILKQEIESVTNIKNQELQSMRFELSSLEMKYQTAATDMGALRETHQKLLGEIEERDGKIKQIEQNVSATNAMFESEKEAVKQENVALQKKVESASEKMKVTEKEIIFMKVQVAKLAKEKEEEKSTRINTLNKLHNTIEEKKNMKTAYEEQINLLEEDIRELKDHLVNVTKDKRDLWQKKDSLEFEIRQKNEERWVNDQDVKQCTLCLTEFSFTVRRHHCRMCGQIFCNNCSSEWLKTAHSRKKIRACRVCAKTFHDKHGDKDVEDDTVLSDTISVHSQYESFDHNDQSDADSTPGNFEVLDSSNITKSGSFGPTEQITIISDSDEIKEAVIPTPLPITAKSGGDDESEDDGRDKNPDEREKITLTVYAGKRCFVPIVVASQFHELSWEFTSAPKDVGFGIAFKKTEEESIENLQTLVPFSRYMSHKSPIHGKMAIDSPGLYYLCFSNAYSRFTSKTVECLISLKKCIISSTP